MCMVSLMFYVCMYLCICACKNLISLSITKLVHTIKSRLKVSISCYKYISVLYVRIIILYVCYNMVLIITRTYKVTIWILHAATMINYSTRQVYYTQKMESYIARPTSSPHSVDLYTQHKKKNTQSSTNCLWITLGSKKVDWVWAVQPGLHCMLSLWLYTLYVYVTTKANGHLYMCTAA